MEKLTITDRIIRLNDQDRDLFWKFYDQIEFEHRLFGKRVETIDDMNKIDNEAYERLIRYKNKLPKRFV